MRKLILFFVLGIGLSLTGCKFETSDNGRLDGFWQLYRIDSLNGRPADMSQMDIYWSVQSRLLCVSNKINNHQVFFRFQQSDDELLLDDPIEYARPSGGVVEEQPVTDATRLVDLGFDSLREVYSILRLDRSDMILQGSRLRLHFRRY